MVVRMARGFASLEFPSTYTMLRDSLFVHYAKKRLDHLKYIQATFWGLSVPAKQVLSRVCCLIVLRHF
jgi:hypothetical protein